MIKLILSFTVLVLAVSCNEKKPDVKTDKGKFSYAVGHEIGRNMKKQGVELHYDSFKAGVMHVMTDKKPLLDDNARREIMKKVSEEKRKEAEKKSGESLKKAEDFLAKNKSAKDVKTTESGLQYQVMKEGTGKKPTADDSVKVHYKGTLMDGSEFDSSYKRNTPAEFPLKGVIPGWTEGVQLMKVGSKYKFWIHPKLGYGTRPNPKIPANSLLTFEVELLDITTKKK